MLASLLLYLVFVAASMALARRVFGRGAALVTGLYLALSPKFLTTFSLNCVGQYVDVLALGGVALALLARLLDDDLARTRGPLRLRRHRLPARSGLLAAARGPRLRGRRRPGLWSCAAEPGVTRGRASCCRGSRSGSFPSCSGTS